MQISDFINDLFEKSGAEGLFSGNVLVAEKGDIIFLKSFGKADYRNEELNCENSIFELASVSKPITAIAVLVLFQQRKLDLDDPVTKWIEDFPYDGITIHHLLTHTSGIPDYMSLMEKYWNHQKIAANPDVIVLLKQWQPPINFLPGTRYEYSNTGYVCLAEIITRAAGLRYADFLKKHLFLPAGMPRTKVLNRRQSPVIPDRFAYGWIQRTVENHTAIHLPEELPEYGYVRYLDGIQGDGMVHSTVRDLFTLDRALASGKLLNEKTMRQMHSPTTTTDGRENRYGYGWILADIQHAGKKAFHSGGWPGYSTMFCRYPDSDVCIIILSNLEKEEAPLSMEYFVSRIEEILFSRDGSENGASPQ